MSSVLIQASSAFREDRQYDALKCMLAHAHRNANHSDYKTTVAFIFMEKTVGEGLKWLSSATGTDVHDLIVSLENAGHNVTIQQASNVDSAMTIDASIIYLDHCDNVPAIAARANGNNVSIFTSTDMDTDLRHFSATILRHMGHHVNEHTYSVAEGANDNVGKVVDLRGEIPFFIEPATF